MVVAARSYTRKRRHNIKHDGWEVRTCPVCGAQLNGKISPLQNRLHVKGVQHRRGAQIRSMLERGCTLEEVAQKVGVSRERVRQIALCMGLKAKGRELRHEKRLVKQLEDFLGALPHTRLGRFLSAAVAHGFTDNQLVEQVVSGRYYRDRVRINGKVVKVKTAWEWTPYKTGTTFIRITNSRTCEVIAYELPDGRWLLLPPFGKNGKGVHSESTSFSLNTTFKGQRGYTLNKAHHYRDAIENWDALR